jgi:hypothetical protein
MTSRKEDKEASRREILALLTKKPFQKPGSANFCHGRLKHFLPDLSPRVSWSSPLPPRGPGGPAWLTATELQDRPEVLQDKVSYVSTCRQQMRQHRLTACLARCATSPACWPAPGTRCS